MNEKNNNKWHFCGPDYAEHNWVKFEYDDNNDLIYYDTSAYQNKNK